MYDFMYYAPTKVYFGKDADKDVGGTIKKEYNPKKIVVVYGGGSAKRSGLFDKITKSIEAAGIAYIEFGGVEANPKVDYVSKCVALCKKENVDFIVAVGGGSVIDHCKSLSLCLANEGEPWDFIMQKATPTARVPMAVVLTIAAAGSEMSKSHVLSNPAIPFKKGLNHDLTRAALAFENPENTYSVSKFQTGCGVVDIMMHTMERYYTIDADNELTDRLSEALLLSVKNAGAVAVKDPANYEARATLMWASSLSHNDLLGCGKNVVAFTVHPLSHAVSAMFDNVAHGAALSVLYPAWAKFIYKHDVRKFCQSATRIWGVPMNFDHPEETALAGIEAMKNYFRSLDMPVTMGELGVGPEHYEALADLITDNGKKPVWSYEPLTKEVIMEIFRLAE